MDDSPLNQRDSDQKGKRRRRGGREYFLLTRGAELIDSEDPGKTLRPNAVHLRKLIAPLPSSGARFLFFSSSWRPLLTASHSTSDAAQMESGDRAHFRASAIFGESLASEMRRVRSLHLLPDVRWPRLYLEYSQRRCASLLVHFFSTLISSGHVSCTLLACGIFVRPFARFSDPPRLLESRQTASGDEWRRFAKPFFLLLLLRVNPPVAFRSILHHLHERCQTGCYCGTDCPAEANRT